MQLVSAAEMRRLDEQTIQLGTPGYALMERAAAGATEVLLTQFPHVRRQRVVVVAGKGNNGGDGLVMARLLRRKGVRAEVVLVARPEEIKGDAARALAAARRARVPIVPMAEDVGTLIQRLPAARLIVDALFGTGLSAAVSGIHADVIEAINCSGVPVFAVDIPSGLDADSGVAGGACVQAEATATFGFAKIGQVSAPGAAAVGALAVVDIGIAPQAIAAVKPQTWLQQSEDVAALVPWRSADAHKGSAGHVLVLAGSRGHSGAALLAAHAACRSGAGLTTLAGPASLNDIFSSAVPEVMTLSLADADGLVQFDEQNLRAALAGKSAAVLGPGLGTHPDAQRVVSFCVREMRVPMVLDADALSCLARSPEALGAARGRAVLTPHPGEMARLLRTEVSQVQNNRARAARDYAVRNGCVLVLKGAGTIVAADNGDVWINSTGNAGMASGGMGDALSGVIGAFLAQGLSPVDAARLAVFVHGAAADVLAEQYAPIGYLASDVILDVPRRLAALARQARNVHAVQRKK